MNKKKALLIVILVLVAVLVGASVLYNNLGEDAAPEQLAVAETPVPAAPSSENKPEESPALPKETSPDFTVYDIDGNAVKLSDFFGKPIVLNFWASWCGPCQMEMPDFYEKYLEIGDEVHFVMVNMTDGSRETVDTASAFLEENGYDFPVFFDTDYSAMMAYGVYSLPTTYFIDGEGCPVVYGMGALTMEHLQQGLDMIMN